MYDKVTGIGKIHYLGETGLVLDASLDLQKDARLPVIQLRDLIKLDNCPGEGFWISRVSCLNERVQKLGFASARKRGIQHSIIINLAFSANAILHANQFKNCGEKANLMLTPIARVHSPALSQYSLTLYFVNADDSDCLATSS